MSTLVRDRATVQPTPAPAREPRRRPSRRTLLLAGAAVLWILGFLVLHGTSTLTLPASELTDLHRSLNQFNAWVAANRADNPVFLYFFTPLRAAVDAVASLFITTFAASSTGLRLPEIGWLGTVGLLGWIAFAIGNARVALLTVAVFVFFGLQGLFLEATYTFALVLTAVLLTLLVGIPLGVLAGVYGRVAKVITPVLDFMQTLPTFVYLAPLALVFLIGPASAVIATVIYAAPPVIRLTAHGIRCIPENTREASGFAGHDGPATAGHPAAAHGPPHHRHGNQPGHHGGSVHGHHRGADRSSRAGPGGGPGAAIARRRHGRKCRALNRPARDRAGPGHHRRQPPSGTGSARQAARVSRKDPGASSLASPWCWHWPWSSSPGPCCGLRRSRKISTSARRSSRRSAWPASGCRPTCPFHSVLPGSGHHWDP